MGEQKPVAPRRDIYQGDALPTPPPPELTAIRDRYHDQPEALITVLEEIQEHHYL